jgi:hypothetical protein
MKLKMQCVQAATLKDDKVLVMLKLMPDLKKLKSWDNQPVGYFSFVSDDKEMFQEGKIYNITIKPE